MRSEHPELTGLAYAALAAIRKQEEAHETKEKEMPEEHGHQGDHGGGVHIHADRHGFDGLSGHERADHPHRAGDDLAGTVLCC